MFAYSFIYFINDKRPIIPYLYHLSYDAVAIANLRDISDDYRIKMNAI